MTRGCGSDVPPIGGFIGSLVLGEMGRDQKETEQNAIGQFLDVHTFQHGLSSQFYALAEDPIADFGLRFCGPVNHTSGKGQSAFRRFLSEPPPLGHLGRFANRGNGIVSIGDGSATKWREPS